MVEKKEGSKAVKFISKNYWMIAALLILVLIFNAVSGISAKQAEQQLVAFGDAQGVALNVLGSQDLGSMYAINVSIQGKEGTFYISKDGKYFIGSAIELASIGDASTNTQTAPTNTQTAPTSSAYSVEDLTKLKEFNQCLATKGVKVYGANWCGWTKKLVETLGGFETASAVYIECTKETELCSREGITGYPTVKLNGVVYTGDRTIAALSQATGCPAPKLTGGVAPVASSGAAPGCIA